MQSFPTFLMLRNRPVLVVGGGENAARKIRLLLKADAAVTVLAVELNSEIAGLVEQGRIAHRAGPFSPASLDGMRLVIGAAGGTLDQAVAAAAQARGVPVNIVDRADLSDFLVPAIVERGDITIGIASNGTAPLLLGRIRAQIEALLPARLGDLAALAGEFRASVARIITDSQARRHFWQRVFDGAVAAKALAGDRAGARSALLAELNGAQAVAEGIVQIVGAGPGDPGLLTLAALQALRDADMILHDAQIAPEILDHARRDAGRIPVGGGQDRHAVSEAEANALMAAHAALGRRVVRLKAGNPDHDHDAAYFAARGIAVLRVPGLPAAPPGPAAAAPQRRRA